MVYGRHGHYLWPSIIVAVIVCGRHCRTPVCCRVRFLLCPSWMLLMQELGAPSKKLAEETGASDKPDRALDESLDDVK